MTSGAPARPGAISPVLTIDNLEEEIEFLHAALGAEVVSHRKKTDSEAAGAELRIGNTTVILRQGPDEGAPELVIWSSDVDASYSRALVVGAACLAEPHEEGGGKRQAMFADPAGIRWRITTVRRLSGPEIERRIRDQRTERL
jgi:PhnB protein